ncbi:hypothetical protein GLAREA_11154 [Glarea lozoyensis ATCC 20868]|uniref:Uncharacterized protein n=1 Tax=Glarea lozoyensis (strain ATCC 20868 / MF5171) TaxID=1116229 RepID=S3DCJ7_GLAL2|nr:uncharacterized protein GLAREA_11154 [Glarea lozoyensis ATCC 20868]EPE35455.1 hypothetical protein GLAREA_11154 [Glarea lozoyensis ATCC 20868]
MEYSPPFTDQEKRNILAEALKKSNVPVERLMSLLNEGGIVPNWSQMVLPYGRTLQSCVDAFESLRSSQRSPYPSLPPPHQQQSGFTSSGSKRKSGSELEPLMTQPPPKRRQSGQDNPPMSARDIRPKPTSANGSPLPFQSASLPPAPQAKKRGRPSKADVEQRQMDAIARGEVLPPSRTLTPKTLKPSTMRDEQRQPFTAIAPMAPIVPSNDLTRTGSPYQGESSAVATEGAVKKKNVRPATARPKGSRISDLLESESDEAQRGPKHSGGNTFQAASAPMTQMQQPQEQQIPPQSFASEPQPIRPKQAAESSGQTSQPSQEPPREPPPGGDPPTLPPAGSKP